jgi:replicative DNA helicase Mcm
MLIGDPGSGKSMMLKRIKVVAPKGRFISGKGVSGAGLTAAVVKDEFLGGWSLEAGALVLANKGIVCIDELDKMSSEDRAAMHEALEGQTITISKANIQATLRCETTVLAAANPKFGRFDPYDTVANQIDLPSTLINRFDLIFPIKDLPDTTKDERMAKFILNLHQHPNSEEPDIDTRLLRKYLAYARQKISPKLTDSAIEELKNYYLKMRASGISEGGVKAIPISARQLEGLVRLAEASARLRLSKKVTKKDAKKAVELLDHCLRLVALDEETGRIDIDRIATDTPATERSKIGVLKEIINELENKLGKTIPLEDIIKEAEEKGLSEADVEEVIQRLKRAGDIFEPRRGFISKI